MTDFSLSRMANFDPRFIYRFARILRNPKRSLVQSYNHRIKLDLMSEIKILLMILTLISRPRSIPRSLCYSAYDLDKKRNKCEKNLSRILSFFVISSFEARREGRIRWEEQALRLAKHEIISRPRERFLSCWTLSRLVGCNIDRLAAIA